MLTALQVVSCNTMTTFEAHLFVLEVKDITVYHHTSVISRESRCFLGHLPRLASVQPSGIFGVGVTC